MREKDSKGRGVDTTTTTEEKHRLAQKMKVRCRAVGVHIDKYSMAGRITDRADMANVAQWEAARQIERELLTENGLSPENIPKAKRQMFNWIQHSEEKRFDDTVGGFWIPWEEERQRRNQIQSAEKNLTPVGDADETVVRSINRRVVTAATRESTNTQSDDDIDLTDSWLLDGIASPIAGWIDAINGVISTRTSSTETTNYTPTTTRSTGKPISQTPTAGVQQGDTSTHNPRHILEDSAASSVKSHPSSNNLAHRTYNDAIGFFTGWASETIGLIASLLTILLQTVLITVVGVGVIVALSYTLSLLV